MQIKTQINNLINYKICLQVEQAVNEFLQKKNYLKIDLPVLSPALIPESYLEVFATEFKYLNKRQKLYLTPSPELFLKRLLAFGIGNCYYLGKSFRNQELASSLHSFEFNMLEIYKIKVIYMDMADEILKMLRFINENIRNKKSKVINYQKKTISLDKWEKISVSEAFEKYAHVSEKELFDKELFKKKVRLKDYQINSFSYEDLFSQVYVQEIEPHLGNNGYPTLIYDYPKEFAALAKLNQDGRTAQRFEFYIAGIELGDCYTELIDWREQEKRFIDEQNRRHKLHRLRHPIDKEFIEALKYGLVPCSGIAIGFDRLAMIFADVDSINKLKLVNII